jgi:hypothetical protein
VTGNIGISKISDSVTYNHETTGDDPGEDDGDKKDPEKDPPGNTGIDVDWEMITVKTSVVYGTNSNSAFIPTLPTSGSTKDKKQKGTFSTAGSILRAGSKRTVTVTFTLEENTEKKVTKDFIVETVSKKQLSTNMIGITGIYTYTGNAITPNFSVADGSLLTNSDYSVAVTNNISAGTASVIIEATSAGNYAGSATRSFTISKARPQGTPAYTKITSDGKTLADANLALPSDGFKNPNSGKTVPGKLAWDDGNTKKVIGKAAYKWTFTPDDTNNYLTLTGTIIPFPTGNPAILDPDVPKDETFGKLFIDVIEGVWNEDAVA